MSEQDVAARDALVGRLLTSATDALELFHVYVGYRLGLYRQLVNHGPLTAHELAERAGINLRYAREWLEQQAVAGIVAFDKGRRFVEVLPVNADLWRFYRLV